MQTTHVFGQGPSSHLCSVPFSRSPDGWVPHGRSLHLVDIENLAGGARLPIDVFVGVKARYDELFPERSNDHVIVGSNPYLQLLMNRLWPGDRVVAGWGKDGADRALLGNAEPRDLSRRFHRVVIGSGDHIFTALARALHDLGVEVVVVGRSGTISSALQRVVASVIKIDLDSDLSDSTGWAA